MRCNIDAKGKALRLVYGCIFLLGGLLLLILWAMPTQTLWAWTISLGLMIGGAFAIFEARTGWCVLRAIGFRTPL